VRMISPMELKRITKTFMASREKFGVVVADRESSRHGTLYHFTIQIRPIYLLFSVQASPKNSSVAMAMQRFFGSPGQKIASHLRAHL
jgi:hypothetical protein